MPHPLAHLPRPISHFLGYRPPGWKPTAIEPAPLKKTITLAISFTFAFLGLTVLQSVFLYDTVFTSQGLPGLITSYGATAILVYGIPQSPLAQPRAVIFGHFFSALTGIIIYNLFNLLPAERFEQVKWLGGSLATAIALVVMDLTGTTHPPAGATAILPVVQADISELNWKLLWIMLLSSVLLVGVGLVGNNMLGRYPVFWIRAEPFSWYQDQSPAKGNAKDEEKQNGHANGHINGSTLPAPRAMENGVLVDFDGGKRLPGAGEGDADRGSSQSHSTDTQVVEIDGGNSARTGGIL